MPKCDRCNNDLAPEAKRRKSDPVRYRPCDYCVWKGDIGPGAQLRSIIAEAREKGSENV